EDSVIKNQQRGYGDGFLGLAFQDGLDASKRHESGIYYLVSQKQIKNPVFSIWISPESKVGETELTKGALGKLVLGGVDTSLYYGSLSFMNIVPSPGPGSSNYFWAVTSGSLSVGSASISPPSGTSTFFDSGGTLIVLDAKTFPSLLNSLAPGKQDSFKLQGSYYTVDCAFGLSLPEVSFSMGGHSFSLAAKDYILPNGANCVLGITSSTRTSWIFGEVFFRKYYMFFDIQNRQVGWALSANRNGNGVLPSFTSANPVQPAPGASKPVTTVQVANPAGVVALNPTASSKTSAAKSEATGAVSSPGGPDSLNVLDGNNDAKATGTAGNTSASSKSDSITAFVQLSSVMVFLIIL
ncbi:hypothetical protein HDU79_008012, partial [Rhizoclosmatium sp. JEL0117]